MKLRALKAAFPHTIPILMGFLFLGMTYGIYMTSLGFSFMYPMMMSMIIFAGSMEFVTGNLLLGAFNPLQAFAMTLLINARHLFYGLSMLEKYRGVGWKKIYMIFGMADETFSINCAVDAPEGVDRGWFMFFVTLLDQCYWITGATLGGLFGTVLKINTEGLDFVMTALFVVILLENMLKKENRLAGFVGLGLSAASLIIFGAESFILPAMGMILLALVMLKKPMEKGGLKV